LLIFQLGQPRIWMSMSRDGLLPPAFSRIHPKYQTPSFATIVTGLVVAIPCLFMNLTEVTDLTSIGTLFAFVVVCSGVLILQQKNIPGGKFKVPFFNSRYVIVPLLVIAALFQYRSNLSYWQHFFSINQDQVLWISLIDKLPMLLFLVTSLVLAIFSLFRKLSLIPVLGLLSCLFLMTKLGYTNWLRFLIWLAVGLLIYFTYSRKKSKLNREIR
jgi:APA family basic amino acid/polyamine antiporter